MDYKILAASPLFADMELAEIETAAAFCKAKRRSFKKGELILRAGNVTTCLGIVLNGRVQIEFDDFWGRKNIIACMEAGDIFGEAYACAGEPLMVNAVAENTAGVLFIDVNEILNNNGQPFMHKLVKNLLVISAQKNLQLSRRMLYTSYKTIRERLLAYLSYLALCSGSNNVRVPFKRQLLADFLHVDRCALSNEISKMQRDGLLKADHNNFIILA